MLKSFYNPDDQQHLEYHKELLKMAAQERLASQCMQTDHTHREPQRGRMQFLHLFSFRAKKNTLLPR